MNYLMYYLKRFGKRLFGKEISGFNVNVCKFSLAVFQTVFPTRLITFYEPAKKNHHALFIAGSSESLIDYLPGSAFHLFIEELYKVNVRRNML